MCDCTLGGAGHTTEMARHIQPAGISVGIDQDDLALAHARARFERELPDAEFVFCKGNFAELDRLLVEAEVPGLDACLFDLGVSSPQLDIAERGFSYHEDAPLDMRMDSGNHTLTAHEVINTYSEADLTRIFRTYGDERFAARIARVLVQRRARKSIDTTLELAELVKEGIPAAARRSSGHPARRVFQAVRIEVNRELEVLEEALHQAIRWLNPGGYLAVISYHSLEDRLVKHIFNEYSKGCICPPDLPVCACGHTATVEVLTRKARVATPEEVAANPRARSALLRVVRKATDF